MTTFRRRRLGIAALIASAALVASQAAAMSAASAKTASPDGGPTASAAAAPAGQTPYLVRDHTAKLAHAMKASQKLRLTVGLKLRNQADLDKLKASLQDVKSPQYHRYLTAAQFNAKYAPSAADESAVLKWATSKGLTVSNRYSNRMLVDLTGTAGQIEKALGVKMNDYTMKGNTYFSNDRDPVLPDSLKSIVSSVDGLNNVESLQTANPSTTPKKPMARYSAGPVHQAHGSTLSANGSKAALAKAVAAKKAHPNITGGFYDPTDLYSSQSYDVDALQHVAPCCNPQHLSGGTPAATNIAIATAGSHAFSSDLAGFHARYGYLAYTLNEYYIDGTPSSLDYEGTMDVEWSMSMGNSFGSYLDTPHIYVYSGVNAAFTTFNDIYNQILTNNTAKIVSSSWGCAEIYCTSDATMNTEHAIFDGMIAQGFTMVNSSGDRGAYADCAHVSVSYPASDPDWLGIGATNLEVTAGPVFSSETAWGDVGNCAGNGGGSGGGCSAKYAAPSWQSVISSFCGSSAKAVPDISLNGDWANSPQNVFFNGGWSGNGGTSISAPMSAGFFARVNGYRIQMGNVCGSGSACGTIGMPGSRLYLATNSGAFGRHPMYDTTSGCTMNEVGSGYCAIPGYDRASGWGTFNFLQLAWALNYWSVGEASPPTVSVTGPSGAGIGGNFVVNTSDNGSPVPSGVAGYTAQFDSAPDDTLTEPHGGSGNSFYSGPATAGTALNKTYALPTGCHTLYVRAWDNIGISALSSYGPVCYDRVAPTVGAAAYEFNRNTTIQNNGAANIHIEWTGSDTSSGIAQYLLYRSTDGGAYSLILSGIQRTHDDEYLDPGHSYTFAVGAYDNDGNFGGYAYSTVTVNTYDQEDASVTYTTNGWTRQAVANSYLGKVKYSTVLNKRVSFAFIGYDVAFVTTKGPAYGNASLKLDGGSNFFLNSNAASVSTRQLTYKSGVVANGSHTLEVRNQGTAGHSRVDIDAFVVLS